MRNRVSSATSIVLSLCLLLSYAMPVIAQEASPVAQVPDITVVVTVDASDDSSVLGTALEFGWTENGEVLTHTDVWDGTEMLLDVAPGSVLRWEATPPIETGLVPVEGEMVVQPGANALVITLQPAPVIDPVTEAPSTTEPENDAASAAVPATPESVAPMSLRSVTNLMEPAAEPGMATLQFNLLLSDADRAELESQYGAPASFSVDILSMDGTTHWVDISSGSGTVDVPATTNNWTLSSEPAEAAVHAVPAFGTELLLPGETRQVDIVIDLVARGTLQVRVLTSDGSPIPQGTTICYFGPGGEDCITYDGTGSLIEFDDLPYGTYSVTVASPDGDTVYGIVSVPQEPGYIPVLVLKAQRTATVRAEIRSQDGQPVEVAGYPQLTFTNVNSQFSADGFTMNLGNQLGDDPWTWEGEAAPGTYNWIFSDDTGALSQGTVTLVANEVTGVEVILNGEQTPPVFLFNVTEAHGSTLPDGLQACLSTGLGGIEPPLCVPLEVTGSTGEAEIRLDQALTGPAYYVGYIADAFGTPYGSTIRVLPAVMNNDTYQLDSTIDLSADMSVVDQVDASASATEVVSGSQVTFTFTSTFAGREFMLEGSLPPGFTVTGVTCSNNYSSLLSDCAIVTGGAVYGQGVMTSGAPDTVTISVTGTLAGEVGSTHTASVCAVSTSAIYQQFLRSQVDAISSIQPLVLFTLGASVSPISGMGANLMALDSPAVTLGVWAILAMILGSLLQLQIPGQCDAVTVTIVAPPTPTPTTVPGVTPSPTDVPVTPTATATAVPGTTPTPGSTVTPTVTPTVPTTPGVSETPKAPSGQPSPAPTTAVTGLPSTGTGAGTSQWTLLTLLSGALILGAIALRGSIRRQ